MRIRQWLRWSTAFVRERPNQVLHLTAAGWLQVAAAANYGHPVASSVQVNCTSAARGRTLNVGPFGHSIEIRWQDLNSERLTRTVNRSPTTTETATSVNHSVMANDS